MSKKISIENPKKIAFVCSGGATKAAAFHMGVTLALQEKGFKFLGGLKSSSKRVAKENLTIDTYIGSSAGSVISAYLASGYSIEQIFNSYLGKTKKNQSALKPLSYTTLMSVKSSPHETAAHRSISHRIRNMTIGAIDLLYRRQKLLSLSGLFTTSGVERYMREDVLPSNDFKDYLPDFGVVATQLNHSKRVIFSNRLLPPPKDDPRCLYETGVSVSDAVAASISLPPIFSPYGIRNKKGKIVYFFDGEIRETLSTNVAEQMGADLIIASYTHQPYHFSREVGSLTKFGITAIGIQAIYLMIERRIQSSIYSRNQKLAALDSVKNYLDDNNFSDQHKKNILRILETKLSISKNTNYIYINPRPSDHEMFFGEHFSFSAKFMEKIVRIGFMAAIETLREYEIK
ncbi:MAG: patatin-like phospholipase family protein [Oligoflexia bacterium]|nr:patatin-like phospholipase family protein [Oligoflexia bacterium]